MKNTMKMASLIAALALMASPARAEELLTVSSQHKQEHHCHEGGHTANYTPVGVMGDHTHSKGSWMVSLRYMHMDMDGLQDGKTDLTPTQVLARGFMVAPLSMKTDMYMFGGMYALTDKVTLMAMIPWVEKEMDHVTMMNVRFKTQSDGLGDLKLSAITNLYEKDGHAVLLNAGISAPTGGIENRDRTPMAASAKLAYPMQIGSGTWDMMPGLTYRGGDGKWGWGAQYLATLRLGENSENYSLGNEHSLTGWVSYRPAEWISTSFRLKGMARGNIDGADPELNLMMMPGADPDRYAGERVDAALGVNFYGKTGPLGKNRLALEISRPVYLDVDGPQLKPQWMFTLGWQKAF